MQRRHHIVVCLVSQLVSLASTYRSSPADDSNAMQQGHHGLKQNQSTLTLSAPRALAIQPGLRQSPDNLYQPLNRYGSAVTPPPRHGGHVPIISPTTAWQIFFAVLVTALLWLILAFVISRQIDVSPALSTASSAKVEMPREGLEHITRTLIAVAEQATFPDWTSGLFDCAKDFGGFCFAFWCPCVPWANNIQRIGLLDYSAAMRVTLCASSVAIFGGLVWLAVGLAEATRTSFTSQEKVWTFFGISVASGLACAIWFAIGVLYMYYRQEMRRKLGLWEADTWNADLASTCCCWPCAIAQETRHLNVAAKERFTLRSVTPLLDEHPFLGRGTDGPDKVS